MFSNWHYATIIVAVGTAVGAALTAFDDPSQHWIPVALGIVAVVTALFAPPPNVGKKGNNNDSPSV